MEDKPTVHKWKCPEQVKNYGQSPLQKKNNNKKSKKTKQNNNNNNNKKTEEKDSALSCGIGKKFMHHPELLMFFQARFHPFTVCLHLSWFVNSMSQQCVLLHMEGLKPELFISG